MCIRERRQCGHDDRVEHILAHLGSVPRIDKVLPVAPGRQRPRAVSYPHLLRDEYDIQIEFGDIGNILAYLSIGDRPQEIERLVSALAEIKRRYHTDGTGLLSQEYIDPVVAASPQEAFYAPKKSLPLRETEGMVLSLIHI